MGFRFIHRINTKQEVDTMKEAALNAGLTEQEVTAYLVYCCGFYGNMGNYKGFGDSKFVPNFEKDRLELLMKSTKAYQDSPEEMDKLWSMVKGPLYSLTDQQKQLGLGQKGITKYFTPNCDQTDSELVNRFMKKKNLEGYINRVIKIQEGDRNVYEIRHAAVEEKELYKEEFEGCVFKVTTGDYNELLDNVCKNLELAVKYAANNDEKEMLVEYVKSFREGSLDRHKDGSRFWIRNKGPIVETYIGFIETYRDPAGMRGEFEGFVSMVNKTMYDRYSEVSEPWASRRQIVVDRKQPRVILVQANTVLDDEKLKLVQYDPSIEGMVKSWAERFPDVSTLDTILAKLADKDRSYWC